MAAAMAPAPAPRKKIVPTLVSVAPDAAPVATFKEKKNPLENTADLIAMRYGISEEAPKIDESVFEKNRNIGKKVVPLKEYFKQAATEFVQKEAVKKEEAIKKNERMRNSLHVSARPTRCRETLMDTSKRVTATFQMKQSLKWWTKPERKRQEHP